MELKTGIGILNHLQNEDVPQKPLRSISHNIARILYLVG